MISPITAGTTAGRASGWTERHVLAAGLAMTGALVAAAAVVVALTALRGGSFWAPIHLAPAGAATVAIGAFMPHFAVTLAGTRPRDAGERMATLSLLALGSIGVVLGVSLVVRWLTGAGAIAMLVGLVLVAVQTVAPARDPLGRRHPIVTVAYIAALVQLAIAVVIGALGATGASPVLAGWAHLRAAHVWIGLFGAISLTIFATLVYLAPTVLGARVRASAWLIGGLVGMLVGPAVTAVGFALDARGVVLAGVSVAALGAVGQLGYVIDAAVRRGSFTSEHDWRLVAVGHLLAGTGWFAAAVGAALLALALGEPLRGWSLGALAIPLVMGWTLQELIGSWTHLAQAVTPGTAEDHARQRRRLAVLGRTRLIGHNLGVGLAWLGAITTSTAILGLGAALVGLSTVVALVGLGRALGGR
jgi:hypothetical protein